MNKILESNEFHAIDIHTFLSSWITRRIHSNVTSYIKKICNAIVSSFLIEVKDVVLYLILRRLLNDKSLCMLLIKLLKRDVIRFRCSPKMFELAWIRQYLYEINRAALNLRNYLDLKGIQITSLFIVVLFLFILDGLVKSLGTHVGVLEEISDGQCQDQSYDKLS